MLVLSGKPVPNGGWLTSNSVATPVNVTMLAKCSVESISALDLISLVAL